MSDKENLNGLVKVNMPKVGGYFLQGDSEDTGFTVGNLYLILAVGGCEDIISDDNPESSSLRIPILFEDTDFSVKDDDGDYRYMNVAYDIDEMGGSLYVMGDK